MKLVRLDNYQIVINEELLLLTPFKILYKKDKTRDKKNFYDFITILYFTYDPRSDYSYIVDDKERLKEVCESNGFEFRKFTSEEQECINLYTKLTTTISLELLKSTKIAIDRVKSFLETIDLNARDDKDKPIYTINTIVSALKLIPQLAKDVIEAERVISKELQEQGKARGNSEMSLLDNGLLNL